jgi:hypothetical protein
MKTAYAGGCTVTLRDDGIVEYRYDEGIIVDLEVARGAIEAAQTILDGSHPALVFIDGVRTVTRPARSFFANDDLNREVSNRVALVTRTPVARVLGNFFLGLNKPRFPTRLFTSEEEAVRWLAQGV